MNIQYADFLNYYAVFGIVFERDECLTRRLWRPVIVLICWRSRNPDNIFGASINSSTHSLSTYICRLKLVDLEKQQMLAREVCHPMEKLSTPFHAGKKSTFLSIPTNLGYDLQYGAKYNDFSCAKVYPSMKIYPKENSKSWIVLTIPTALRKICWPFFSWEKGYHAIRKIPKLSILEGSYLHL